MENRDQANFGPQSLFLQIEEKDFKKLEGPLGKMRYFTPLQHHFYFVCQQIQSCIIQCDHLLTLYMSLIHNT